MPHTQRRTGGFTIVEMLITIVIVSILATLALPSYRQYVMRANRTVAKAALQDLVTRQESYALDHKGYATSFSALGITGTGAYVTSDGVLSGNAANALYTFTLASSSGTVSSCALTGSATRLSYALIATPATNADTKCGNLCFTSAGDRGSSLSTVADCWRR